MKIKYRIFKSFQGFSSADRVTAVPQVLSLPVVKWEDCSLFTCSECKLCSTCKLTVNLVDYGISKGIIYSPAVIIEK